MPLHLLNVMVPEVPFAGCLFMDGVGLKWMQPKGDRRESESSAGLGSDPPLQPPDLVLQCLYVLRFLQPALSPALQQQRSPLGCLAPGAQRGAAPTRSLLRGRGKRQGKGPGDPQNPISLAGVSPTRLRRLPKGVRKPLRTGATSSSKATHIFY